MNFPNQQFIYRITQGDEAAFSQLCAHFQFPAFKFCTVILKDEKQAERITQDVFNKIWNERSDLKMEDDFRTFLFRNLKIQVLGQMKSYIDPNSQELYLEKIQSFSESGFV